MLIRLGRRGRGEAGGGGKQGKAFLDNRDLKIRGREGQDGNGSGHGKLARVPSCPQKQKA